MARVYANNALSTLASAITNVATTLDVQSGHGARFPSLTAPDVFRVTIDDGTNIEVVEVTARSTDTLTIVRGLEGTTGTGFSAGAKVELRWTKESADDGRLVNGGLLTVTPSADQDDYNPTGFSRARIVRLNPSADIVISGFVAGADDRGRVLLVNVADRLIILERESTSSAAANRMTWESGLPYFLMPGGSVELWYDPDSDRWRLWDGDAADPGRQFDMWSDGGGQVAPYMHWLSALVSGTGAAASHATGGVNATAKAQGCTNLTTGTTATGRAALGWGASDAIEPKLGNALFLVRGAYLANLSTGTERFQVRIGLHDGGSGTDVTDGVYWEYDDAASANWRRCTANNSTRSKTSGSLAAAATTHVWFGVWLNANWTRAVYFYSTDGINWIIEGTETANLPAAARTLGPGIVINKTVGTTARTAVWDAAGMAYRYVR